LLVVNMSDANNTTHWKDVASLYPPAEDIVKALQDRGKKQLKKNKGKDVERHVFPLLEKLAGKLFAAIQSAIKPPGLTVNPSRGKQPLYKELVLSRRHVDVTETDPFFHSYARDGKVYLISNNASHCGLDQAIQHFQEYHEHQLAQKNSARTPNDGLRLACILLDPTYRGSVSGLMSKKKDRKKSDLSKDPNTTFFEEILGTCFMNNSYVAGRPADEHYNEFPEDEKGSWDPNDPSVFENERTPLWLQKTWDDYVRTKYKKALDKWNKETGGGDGVAANFINYCGSDRWPVHVFCMDLAANFLLASSAAGRMPAHLQVEAGFGEDLSSVSDQSPSTRRSSVIEKELSDAKRQRTETNSLMSRVVSLLDDKSKGNNRVDDCLQKVADYSHKMQDDKVLDTMSPESRKQYLGMLQQERKKILTQMTKGSDESS
jgi:hypothetical protein